METRPRDHGDLLRPEMDLLGRTRALYVGTLSGTSLGESFPLKKMTNNYKISMH